MSAELEFSIGQNNQKFSILKKLANYDHMNLVTLSEDGQGVEMFRVGTIEYCTTVDKVTQFTQQKGKPAYVATYEIGGEYENYGGIVEHKDRVKNLNKVGESYDLNLSLMALRDDPDFSVVHPKHSLNYTVRITHQS